MYTVNASKYPSLCLQNKQEYMSSNKQEYNNYSNTCKYISSLLFSGYHWYGVREHGLLQSPKMTKTQNLARIDE